MEKLKNMATTVIAVAMIIGFSAFKIIESRFAPTTKWYEVTIAPNGSPSDMNDQLIGAETTAPPQTNPSACAIDNSETICKIQLTLADSVSTPSTVQQAHTLPDAQVKIEKRAFLPEED